MQNSKRGPKGIGAKRKQPHPFPFRPEPNEKFSCKHVQGWPIVFLKIQEKNDGCHPRAGIHYYAVNRLPSRKNITVRLFSILLQVIAFESNPFLWDVTSENVTSDVLDISIKTNESYVHFSQLEEPFELFIPLKKQKKQGTDDKFFVKWSNSFENIRYHKIIIPSDGAVAIIDIVPVENNFLDIFISADPGLLH